jgi:hypothetical protein
MGKLIPISICLKCDQFITQDEILGLIICNHDDKKWKNDFIDKIKEYHGEKPRIEFGGINE